MRKKYLSLLSVFFLVGIAQTVWGGMSDYCSAPPYVTRTIPPNIMVLMDNSQDMLNPAYPDENYDKTTTYPGYFKPEACYSYSSNLFQEEPNNDPGCPSTAPFRGNLMNWATMSKFDVLQKVLIGGNTASKQGNAHKLLSISNDWPDKVHNGCIFQVDNANLTITEASEGECSLLGSDPEAIDLVSGPRRLGLPLGEFWSQVGEQTAELAESISEILENVSLVPNAYAGQPCPDIETGALDAKVNEDFFFSLSLPKNSNNKTATWTFTTIPAWLSGPTYSKYNGRLIDGVATFTGDTAVAGSYPFQASVTSNACDGTSSISGNIVVAADDVVILHYDPDLPAGEVGEAYHQEIFGQGGVDPKTWTVTGLPPGLSATDYGVSVVISGTPTVAGTSTISLTLTDDLGDSATREVTLLISEGLTITTNSLPGGQVGQSYSASMAAIGGAGSNVWTIISGSLPSGVNMGADGIFSGTLASGSEGTYALTIQVTDDNGTTVSKSYIFEIVAAQGHVEIFSESPLPDAFSNIGYSYQLKATGGCDPYTWVVSAGSLPSWMSLSATGLLSGTPDNNQDTTYANFDISVTGCGGHTAIGTFTLTSYRNSPGRSASFSVKIELVEEDLTDLNGNDIWDDGESYVDSNGNGEWDGKKGIFHVYWDTNEPRARWGMTKFKDQGNSTIVEVDSCIPVGNPASFFTAIQNATPADNSPLSDGLYGAINYYGFNNPYGQGYSGCNNSDPIDNVPCRKNFVLVLTSGADLSGDSFSTLPGECDVNEYDLLTNPLVKNACYGQQTDLRTPDNGSQNVHTFIVNTLGEPDEDTEAILKEAAELGGGDYYAPDTDESLEDQLANALDDILAQAASGTAVSVLTTSSRGVGSMMQAYFLPVRQDNTREIEWTGYVQNLWIDNDDNLREDTVSDLKLKPSQDEVLKLFFDEEANETKAALFTEDELAACSEPTIDDFGTISYNWEGGKKLALRPPSEREIFTSTKVIRGGTTSHTFAADSGKDYPVFKSTMSATLLSALNATTPYSSDEIVGYIRGECLEGSVSGNTDCGATYDADYRDRRVTVDDGGSNGNVWKLGDIISSTPKVLAATPNNTYHIDYADATYLSYTAADSYAERSSIAFVGANDGMLHAFRVGYLEDNPSDGVLGMFKNIFGDSGDNNQVGDEIWGYIPFNAFPYLQYLADPDYCHIYYNDLSVRLVDASLGCPDSSCNDPNETRQASSWRTLLIGGMRFGGACDGGNPAPPVSGIGYSAYYAIDVTDAENPIPLWEFSDADLGYTSGFPSIVRTGSSASNGNWYVAFGSGSTTLPRSATDINRTSTGYLYLLDMKTGALAKKIALDHNAIVGDVLSIDKDKDYVSEKLYFGTSYLDSGTWKGKLLSMTIPNQDLTAAWTPAPTAMFAGNYPFTASPDAAKDEESVTWVYSGSGKYYSDVDEDTSGSQIFIGLKDHSSITYPVTLGDSAMLDKTNVTTTGTVDKTQQVCSYDPNAAGKFTYKTVVTSTTQTSAAGAVPGKGWYYSLQNGERVISRPLAVGGLVDFLTYKPSSDDCSYGGDSYLYALDYKTGEAPAAIAIRDSQATGGVTSGSVDIAPNIKLGPGAPPTGEAIIIPPLKKGQEELSTKIQVSTGVIVEVENKPLFSPSSDLLHWLEK